MRPLWFDFPADARAWDIEDEYLFGPCVLVAPVTEFGARSRHLYLPEGGEWTDAYSREVHGGGQWVTVAAPLQRIPVFLRDGAVGLPSLYPPPAGAAGG